MAKRLSEDLCVPCHIEQRRPRFDKRHEDGTTTEARLDIAVDLDGVTHLIDVAVVDVLSTDAALERQRAVRDGAAARMMEDKKCVKYLGPNVVPLVIESYGLMNTAGLAWLRRAYHGEPDKLQSLLRTVSVLVQSHTSAMILAACSSLSSASSRARAAAADAEML